MKRRDFLGAPLAVAALSAGAFASRTAAAGTVKTIRPVAMAPFLMRLDGSTGKTSDQQLLDNAWQTSWASSKSALRSARLTLYGLVRAPRSTLGQLNVEAVYFGADKALNTALIYRGAGDARSVLSKGVDVQASSFGGFILSNPAIGSRAATNLGTVVVGDNATGLMMPGLYALMLPAAGQSVYAGDYLFSTYEDRPLMRRDGVVTDVDYLSFSIAALR